MDAYCVCEVQPADATVAAIREITTDLCVALEAARYEGDVTYSTFIHAWRIVDNWQGAINARMDARLSRQLDPNYQPVRKIKYQPGMEIPVK